ncbi:MAG: nucleotidyltransferase family protein [Patescibacteria group bacterium]
MSKKLMIVKNLINRNRQSLAADFGVSKIGIFGSVARGDDNAKSDVDVLVKLTKPVGFFSFINLEDQLTKIIGQKVDLATENSLKPIIKKEILSEVIYV